MLVGDFIVRTYGEGQRPMGHIVSVTHDGEFVWVMWRNGTKESIRAEFVQLAE